MTGGDGAIDGAEGGVAGGEICGAAEYFKLDSIFTLFDESEVVDNSDEEDGTVVVVLIVISVLSTPSSTTAREDSSSDSIIVELLALESESGGGGDGEDVEVRGILESAELSSLLGGGAASAATAAATRDTGTDECVKGAEMELGMGAVGIGSLISPIPTKKSSKTFDLC